MIGSSGAEALSRATGDEQLLKTQALTNNQRRKRNPEDEQRKREEESENSEQETDSFQSSVSEAQNQQIQALRQSQRETHETRRKQARMQASRKLDEKKPVVDEAGHIDVSG